MAAVAFKNEKSSLRCKSRAGFIYRLSSLIYSIDMDDETSFGHIEHLLSVWTEKLHHSTNH